MPNYPEPADNPACQCRANPMQAFFCMTGHMLECHYPYTCAQAGCSHLAKYDPGRAEAVRLQANALKAIDAGVRPPYGLDPDGNVIVEGNDNG